jgi:phosphoglycolate phosphatase
MGVADCVYVGDAARDIEAAHAAGMPAIAAAFGYLGPDDDPHAWGADAVAAHPQAVRDWLAGA